MRYLEVRRHGRRTKPHAHLSQEGVSQARRVGNGMGDFDRVVTSTLARAHDTAIAMGYAVDAEMGELSPMEGMISTELDTNADYAEAARVFKHGKHGAKPGRALAALWRDLACSVPDGRGVLAVTHGGVIELGAVACLPDADHAAWGPTADYCEGVRLAFDGERFVDAEILRLSDT